ncbi:MAG: UDP-N-acetylmuramate dehydrogenase [Paracoccaceae bacterium]|nr:UDP-N-acetylmuramate dehydrogenase [Paracoccaceae bacterium]
MTDCASVPAVRGTLEYGRVLAPLSWLRVGGAAEVFFQPADEEDLRQFLASLPGDMPVMPIGACSNLLIRDGGIAGAVIRLGRAFGAVSVESGGSVKAGAAALAARVAVKAAASGIDLAFFRTIPGTVGGAVKMNAGCYGRYLADVLVGARAVCRDGTAEWLDSKQLDFGYRKSALPDDCIVTEVELAGPRGDPGRIERDMQTFVDHRERTQPVRERTCGSVFRNPAGRSSSIDGDDTHDLKAWKLIEDAGMRGAGLGGAQVSERHANFLVNTGGATAEDLEGLGEKIRTRVFQYSGVWLEWEIKRVGNPRRNAV